MTAYCIHHQLELKERLVDHEQISLGETNFISKISGYCQQHSYSLSYIEVKKEGPSHIPLFYYKLVIDKKDYPEAQGKTIKEAKQKAAQMAWSHTQGEGPQISGQCRKPSTGCIKQRFKQCRTSLFIFLFNSTNQSLEETNFIPKISGYCQQHSYSLSYIEVKKEGPSHNPLFYYKLVIDKKDYPEAQGKNIKEAKQKAAQRAWSDITKHLSVDSKVSFISFYCFLFVCLLSIVFVKDADMKRETGNGWRQSQFDSFEALGDGGFGWVFKARKKDLDKFFAIKEIKARDLKKSLHEAQVLADLLHTNIVRYYNSWLENTGYRWPNSQVLFIQMELCDGGTLRSWIYEKNKESMGIGVVYIHSKKLIHRDLKPENIFFGQDGNVRIGDFGLVTQDHDEIVERTEDRGTPNYMAPEQVGVNYDRKVDVFALGLIFFELFWKIATAQERYLIWPDVRSQKLPEEFTGLSHIIKNMLNENPKARPEASTLTTELEKWKAECNADKGNQTI
uniref:Uncharacterized protein n=1 Tax=Neogobius melanostomus TaxID=47308 RepID=A0A8C6T2F2_9GOBI